MKRNLLYMLLLGAAVVGFVFFMRAHRQYDWNTCFGHDSEQPFGCAYFDAMAEATMPHGYSYREDGIDSLLNSPGGIALMVLDEDGMTLSPERQKQLEAFVRRGNKVLLCAKDFFSCTDRIQTLYLPDSVSLDVSGSGYFDVYQLRSSLIDGVENDTVTFYSGEKVPVNDVFSYRAFDDLNDTLFAIATKKMKWVEKYTIDDDGDYTDDYDYDDDDEYTDDEDYADDDEYAEDGTEVYEAPYAAYADDEEDQIEHVDDFAVSIAVPMGKGWFYADCNPLLFTNYALTHRHLARYHQLVMSLLADCEVVRMPAKAIDWKGAGHIEQQSPFTFFLSQAPLRWALYTVLAAALLFMAFTARRRQRVIPVVELPQNRNVQFAKLIGAIYYHHRDRTDLLRKKFVYFKDTLRRKQLVDLDDRASDEANFQRLAMLTGASAKSLAYDISLVRLATDGDTAVSASEMMHYIDLLDGILDSIK